MVDAEHPSTLGELWLDTSIHCCELIPTYLEMSSGALVVYVFLQNTMVDCSFQHLPVSERTTTMAYNVNHGIFTVAIRKGDCVPPHIVRWSWDYLYAKILQLPYHHHDRVGIAAFIRILQNIR